MAGRPYHVILLLEFGRYVRQGQRHHAAGEPVGAHRGPGRDPEARADAERRCERARVLANGAAHQLQEVVKFLFGRAI